MVEKTINIFISYAHEDEGLRKALETHLSLLKRQNLIKVWDYRDINAGTDWKQAINTHLNGAQIILLLISPDFIASDYCYSIEMARAMQRHENGEARVIPILLRPTRWQGTPFGKLRVLPSNAKPVISQSGRSQDDAFQDIVKGIERYIDDLLGLPTRGIRPSDWERFSKNAKTVLGLAKEEALRFHHHSVGTEHLLLGFLRGQGVASRVLKNLDVELDKVRQKIVENSIVLGDITVNGDVDLTPHAKKVIELAADEAHRLGHHYIGTEHLLLGLILEGKGTATTILKDLGVSLEKVRTHVLEKLP